MITHIPGRGRAVGSWWGRKNILDKGTDVVNSFDTFLLTMAMTALGAETSFDKFKKAGIKPFLLAGGLYLWLVAGGYFVALLIA